MTLLERIRVAYPEGTRLPAPALLALAAAGEVPAHAMSHPHFRERMLGASLSPRVAPGLNLTTACEAWLHDSCDGMVVCCGCRCHW